MGTMTKKDRRAVETALDDAERAFAYIHRDDVAVCRVGSEATTSIHYSRKMDGRVLYEVERGYGSDLCRLEECIKALRRLLAPASASPAAAEE